MNNKIVYVTGNKFKILTAKKILEPLGFEIEAKKIDCPEIQADSIEEVAKYSSKYASEFLKTNVLKNDSGIIIPALGGFPGPYTHYVEDTLTEDGILKLMNDIDNRYAYFLEVLAYTEYGEKPKVFISKTEGTISNEKKGEFGWSFDSIFIPKGEKRTLAEIPDEERWKYWDDLAYEELSIYLKKKIKKGKAI